MRRTLALTVTLTLLLAACGDDDGPTSIRLLSHDSFRDAVTDETFAAFTEETGIRVEVIAAGDAGSMVNQAVLSRDNPLADVLFGIDDTYLSRALDNDLFVAHRPDAVDDLDPSLLIPGDLATPIDYGDVCLNYDKDWFEANDVPVPTSLEDLRDPEIASLLVVTHPATSSPGLAFLLATIETYGEDDWHGFWEDLVAGGMRVVTSWSTAYYEAFTRYGGDRPIVLSYASSPPAEVMFADEPLDEAPTGVVTDGCYRQVEYAGILSGTAHEEAAGRLIDFMLSVEFQETIPENWFVYPANRQAALPPVFAEHTVLPPDPARLDPDAIGSNRERWINEWIEIVEG
jgi:thiamine transport system substrate-binding protein